MFHFTQPAITCSKLVIETLEKGVKYVQVNYLLQPLKMLQRKT